MEVVQVYQGDGPVVLAFPHVGTGLPAQVAARLNDEGRILRDTDWYIHDLYAGLIPGLTTVTATQSRYVIDVNRDPSGISLYPGQATTGLIPQTTFDNVPIWDQPPSATDVAQWLDMVHRPYHTALMAEVARVRARHGVAVLYDCHSIRSRVPWLFEGVLSNLNIGTNSGTSCALELEQAATAIAAASGHSWVLNGRFKGGWTTRHHGRPDMGVHAIQMELSQISHLASEDPPFALDPDRTAHLRKTLTEILATLADLAPRLAQHA